MGPKVSWYNIRFFNHDYLMFSDILNLVTSHLQSLEASNPHDLMNNSLFNFYTALITNLFTL